MESSNGSSVYGLINSNNNFYIGYNSNNGAGFPLSSFSGRFFIKSNGNVGIGTNEPAEKLHVNGRMYL